MTLQPWPIVTLSILIAALFAALTLGFQVAAVILVSELLGMSSPGAWSWVGLVASMASFPVLLIGLAFIGAPTWMVMHWKGLTGKRSAMVAGAFGVTSMGAPILFIFLGPAGLALSATLPITGAVAGSMIRDIAYRDLTQPPAPPA